VDAVLEDAQAQPGQIVADLYAGAGLFSAFLADAVGPEGRVYSVEASRGASKDARRNLLGAEQAIVLNGPTDKVLGSWLKHPERAVADGGLADTAVDTVVLDPPRSGAGRRAVERILALRPGRIVYVSCDPASFARDLAWLREGGYEVERARVFDLYPDTHHLESVTVLRPAADLVAAPAVVETPAAEGPAGPHGGVRRRTPSSHAPVTSAAAVRRHTGEESPGAGRARGRLGGSAAPATQVTAL